jgi:hypothetical protein
MTDYASTRPAPRSDASWFQRFAAQLVQTQTISAYGGQVDLLLLGDSITEACSWMSDYQKHLSGLKILYFGIGGDQTQHVLWRIENGVLDGIRPRFATLLIGVNNFWPDTPVDEIAAGSIACGRAMRAKLAETRLFHFGVLPLGSGNYHLNDKVVAINRAIEAAATAYGATYESLRDVFLTADGKEIPGMLQADGLHLNPKAYDAWGARVKALVGG